MSTPSSHAGVAVHSVSKQDLPTMASTLVNSTAPKSIAVQISAQDVNRNDTKKQESSSPEVKLWGISLSHLSPTLQFIILCVGVFFFFILCGYLLELIFRLEGFKPYGWYLTLVQFGLYTMFGLTERQFLNDKTRKIPLKTYSFIAFLTVTTLGLSNSSLGYLSFPTKMIFKSCKLIPVFFGSIIIQGKKYGLVDFLACLCMSIGLIFFTLADSSVSPTFSVYGVTLISMSLCADAVIGNVQEKVMKQYGSLNSEMVLYSYSIGFLYLFAGQVLSGQLIPAFQFCWEYPVETYGYAFLFSVSGYMGLNVLLVLLKSYGALTAVTVTTCRKALSIILSFVFFAKPFVIQYVWSGVIVVLGIYLNVYSKNRASWNAKFVSLFHKYVSRRRSLSPTSSM